MRILNLLNYKDTSYILIVLCYLSIATEVSILNNIYFIIVGFYSILQNYFSFKYKKIFSGIFALLSFYLQFILNDYTLSKEYFINILLILMFLKFSELEKKENYYFFNYITIFIAISSLLYGQDLISSFISFSIIILSLIHLYSLNQDKFINLNFINLIRYLMITFGILPFIVLTYLIFPRTEINIKLFETKINNLGIPDKISLGSFENISNNEEEVFVFSPENKFEDQKYYFRVKTFNILDLEKNWISTDYISLLNQFSNDLKIKKTEFHKDRFGKIILYPHEKKWIPKLSNYNYKNQSLTNNIFDNLIYSKNKIIRKTPLDLYYQNIEYNYEEELIKFYSKLPNNISLKLKQWADNNYSKSKNDKDYLQKILDNFSNGNYFYNLSPKKIGNNYEKFFFETKTGYCEYYAGTFAILSRLAGIPTRLISGYYGGSFNPLGNFYIFKQQDAHSWVEVFINNEWIRYDPTIVIPLQNVINSNNENFNNDNLINQNSNALVFENKDYVNIVNLYFDYANYLWTNNFIKYDETKRNRFIEEKIKNFKLSYDVLNYIIILIIIYIITIIYKIIRYKKIYFNYFFKKLRKFYSIRKNNLTHQELFQFLPSNAKKQFEEIFNLYEKTKFSKSYQIDIKKMIRINFEIFKIKKPPKNKFRG